MGDWFTIERLDGDTFAISEYRHWEETHCYLQRRICGGIKSVQAALINQIPGVQKSPLRLIEAAVPRRVARCVDDGHCRPPAVREQAAEKGAGDRIAPDPGPELPGADVVVLCQDPAGIRVQLPERGLDLSDPCRGDVQPMVSRQYPLHIHPAGTRFSRAGPRLCFGTAHNLN